MAGVRSRVTSKPKRPILTGAQFVQIRSSKGMLSGSFLRAFWRVLEDQGLDAFVPSTWNELDRHLRLYKERSLFAVTWRWTIPVPPGHREGVFQTLLMPWSEAML